MTRRHPRRAWLVATGLAPLTLIALTACSSSDADPTQTPSPTSTAERTETVYNDCIDGAAQIWLEKPVEHYRFGDCEAVNLISADGRFTLGHVDVLTVEGSNAVVSVSAPVRIAITGNDNRITYTGGEPEVEDLGTGNTVVAG